MQENPMLMIGDEDETGGLEYWNMCFNLVWQGGVHERQFKKQQTSGGSIQGSQGSKGSQGSQGTSLNGRSTHATWAM